jgi:hypothetical protein
MARAAGGALLCAAALAAVSYGVWWALQDVADQGFGPLVVVVVVAVAVSGAVYLGLARLLKLEELSVVRQVLRRRGRRGGAGPEPDPPAAD